MAVDMTFGEWLKRRRRQLDLTQQELADQVGCSVGTIRKIEQDVRRPSKQLAELLATQLDILPEQQSAFISFARTEAYMTDMPDVLAAMDETIPELPPMPTAVAAEPSLPPEIIRHNLPLQVTPFLGRVEEIAVLTGYLTDPNKRLITIVGPGGMGKTRLALAVAEQLLQANPLCFSDGITFVPLAPLSQVAHIVPAIAAALDISLDAGGETRQQLLNYLQQKQLLLIMDNCEHLLAGVELMVELWQTAPGVHILATSRERLLLYGEQVYLIEGLTFPDEAGLSTMEEVAAYTAVQLFLQCAQQVRPKFALQADDLPDLIRICRLVAGMPLGLELAAAWVEMLSLADIGTEIQKSLDFLETELRNMPERHRSLRAVFTASWQQLSREEQAIFMQLSIFRGGFTREAAEVVTGAGLRQLSRLVFKSLLQYRPERDRYQVHELLSQYGAEKLAEDDGMETPALSQAEVAVRTRHSTYYCTFLQQREIALKSAGVLSALAEIDAEIDNVRQAWSWAVEQGQLTTVEEAAESMGWFYYWPGRHQEGLAAFKQAAERMEAIVGQLSYSAGQELRLWATLLGWQGQYSAHSGQLTEARQLCQKALAILDKSELSQQDTRLEKAFILEALGTARGFLGQSDMSPGIAVMEQSLAIYRELEDQWGIAYLLIRLANLTAWYTHDYALAESRCLASWPLTQASGHPLQMVWLCLTLGRVVARQGRAVEAEDWLKQGQAISHKINYLPGVFNGLLYSAEATIYQGQFIRALTLLEETLALRSTLDFGAISEGWVEEYQSMACLHLGRYQEAHRLARTAITVYEQRDNIKGIAFGRWLLANSRFVHGENREALSLLQQSAQTCRETGEKRTLNLVKVSQSYILCKIGYKTEAQQLLAEVLDFGLNHRSFLHVLMVIPAKAMFLAEEGKVEQAIELYALATSHAFVGNSRWFADVVGQHFQAIAATLSPEVAMAAQARGRELDLWQTAESLLAGLQPGR